MTSIIGVTLAGVDLAAEVAAADRSVEHARVGQRALIDDGAGGLLVAERWAGREITLRGTGHWPPALSGLSLAGLVSLTYPDLETDAPRTVQGVIVRGPDWSDDLATGPRSRWSLTLRELSALSTDGGLSVGGVAVALAARVGGVTIRREPNRAYTLLQMASGAAVPCHAWSRWRYVIEGSGWVPPGLTSLDPAASVTLVSVPYGTVACWLVAGPTESWQWGADGGPRWGWSVTLQAQGA